MPRSLTLAFSLLLTVACAPRTPAQGAAPAARPSNRNANVPTVRASANLVIVDVTVTDKQGHPVHGLKQSDFNLLENKAPQTIKSFDEHTGLSAADAAEAKVKPMPKMPPGVFTNETPAPINSAVNVLLLDTLNTPLQDQIIVRQQLIDYVNKEKPGVSVAVFGLSTRFEMFQDFTSDPEVLKEAVKQLKNLKISSMLDKPVSGNDILLSASGAEPAASLQADVSGAGLTMAAVQRMAAFQSTQQSLELRRRAKDTLDAMNLLARYLADIPGRKNLIWFSGSFPLTILPDTDHTTAALLVSGRHFATTGSSKTGGDPFAGVVSVEDEFRRAIDLLSRSQVAVYPVYAKGSTAPPMFSAEGRGADMSPYQFTKDSKAFFSQTGSEHSTMLQLAEGTGGEAFLNTNDLTDAVDKAIGKGSNYYTLTYTPSVEKWDEKYRSIQVKLQQQGYTLAYRRGYYTDNPKAHPAISPADPSASPDAPMQLAMKYAAPPATQILFKIRVQPASDAAEDRPAPGNQLSPEPKTSAGPFHRYAIDYLADADALGFEKSSTGAYRDDFEYVACVYALDGTLINVVSNSLGLSLTAAQRATVMQRGLPYHQEVSVPAKGPYMIRVAIHDLKTDRIGALELPVASLPAPTSAQPKP